MKRDVFGDLKEYYSSVAIELSGRARQAGLLQNPTGVGTEREEVYRTFLERHLPKICDVFLGGYVFDLQGNSSSQMDVIVTGGKAPRFRLPAGNHYIAPVEGTIAIAEIKSRLDRDSLQDSLEKCASIPAMPDQKGIVPPLLKIEEDSWQDTPYKIVFAYDGIDANTICGYITSFYDSHRHIPLARRPNIIHVLGKYMISRTTPNMTVLDPNGQPATDQPNVGQYYPFDTDSDVSALGWTLNEIQNKASLESVLLFKYDEWHNRIAERIQRELAR